MTATTQTTIQAAEVARPLPVPSLWGIRDYWVLWLGQTVSSVGTQVSGLALPLLILAITHSPAQAGLLAAARGIPYILLSLPAGALVDRWDRRRVMLLCDTGRALALGSVPAVLAWGHLSLIQLYIVSLIEGTLFVFFNMAETGCLTRVVPPGRLAEAVAMNQGTEATAGLLGPSLGGVLYGLGRMVPFLADAVSYALSVGTLLCLRGDFTPERTETQNGHLWDEIRDGLRWLWRQRVMRFIALLTGGLMIFSSGYTLVLIVLAQHLHATSAQIGLILATGGLGSIAGSLVAVPLQRRFQFGPLMIAATWVWALSWPLCLLGHNLIALGIANTLAYAVVPVYMGVQYAYRLQRIPDALQGRVNSVFRLLAFGFIPIGLAMSGFLLQMFGPVATIWLLLVPQLVLCIAAQSYAPLRHARGDDKTA